MTRKVKIDRSNSYRAILTDTLPYELPLFFTNERLFTEATRQFKGMPRFVRTLLTTTGPTRPLSYLVQKGGGAFRKITVVHPSAQLKFAELYGRYDTFIENACSRSNFSLRYPSRVGSHYFQKQYLSSATTDGDFGELDEEPMSMLPQRKWASTYFSYKNYTQIHKFFLSEEFSQLEQRYKYMLKVDIARCFESIYTHSIAWALRGKEFAKENKRAMFFEAEFDELMRDSNWGETNGITIGAEVSRIFAEIILQSLDLEIERKLKDIINRIDIRRYVDDYFAFANSHEDINKIKESIEICASSLNLHLNERKTEIHQRPLISRMAVARAEAMLAANEFMSNARKSLRDIDPIYFSTRASEILISKIRNISRSNDTEYGSLASPILAVLSRELARTSERISSDLFDRKKEAINVITAILRVTAFLFHTDIRAATAHKVAQIFYETHLVVNKTGISARTFEGLIIDIVKKTLLVSSAQKIHGPEIINLLVAADGVCKSRRAVSPDILKAALGQDIGTADSATALSYFDLVSALYFSRRHPAFFDVRRVVNQEIESRVRLLGNKLHLHADATMLFFDYISCPYVDKHYRLTLFSDVAKAYGCNASSSNNLTGFDFVIKRIYFVNWKGASQFRILLERRELHPAYDL